jgi:hypothetical protein
VEGVSWGRGGEGRKESDETAKASWNGRSGARSHMECHTRWEEEQVGGLMYSILRFFIFILNLIIYLIIIF